MTISAPASAPSITDVPEGFPAGTIEPPYLLTESLNPDPAGVFDSLSAADRSYRDRARAFVQDEVLPVITGVLGTR
jgi:glutaryl-CoA dehydrogenase